MSFARCGHACFPSCTTSNCSTTPLRASFPAGCLAKFIELIFIIGFLVLSIRALSSIDLLQITKTCRLLFQMRSTATHCWMISFPEILSTFWPWLTLIWSSTKWLKQYICGWISSWWLRGPSGLGSVLVWSSVLSIGIRLRFSVLKKIFQEVEIWVW